MSQSSYTGKTAIHKRFADLANELAKLAGAVNALALEQQGTLPQQKAGLGDIVNAIKGLQITPPTVVNINVSVYIILVNLNLFIWWSQCRGDYSHLDCLFKKVKDSSILKKFIDSSADKKLQTRVREIFSDQSETTRVPSQSSDKYNSPEEAEKWRKKAKMIENLCLEILGYFPEGSPPEKRWYSAPPAAQEKWEEQLTEETLTTASPLIQQLSQVEVLLIEENLDWEEQLTEETLIKASPLIQQLSQVEVLLIEENLDVDNLNRLETQLKNLHDELGKYPDLGPQELVRIASEPLHDNKSNSRYHRLLILQKLRLLILQYFVSK
jgi:hypothetical protein